MINTGTAQSMREQFMQGKHCLRWGTEGTGTFPLPLAVRVADKFHTMVQSGGAVSAADMVMRFFVVDEDGTRRKYLLDLLNARQIRLSPCDERHCPADHLTEPKPHVRPLCFDYFTPGEELEYRAFQLRVDAQRAEQQRLAASAVPINFTPPEAEVCDVLLAMNRAVVEGGDADCLVCTDSLAQKSIQCIAGCWHSLCADCMLQLSSMGMPKCPMCRREFTAADIRMNAGLMALLAPQFQ
jgi:hypothetical protein